MPEEPNNNGNLFADLLQQVFGQGEDPGNGSDVTGDPQDLDIASLFRMAFGGGAATPFAEDPDTKGVPGFARQIGEFGDVPLAQADVRTPFMRSLEMASAPALFQTLLNPAGTANMLGGQPLGTGGSGAGQGLLSQLLGGGGGQQQSTPDAQGLADGGQLSDQDVNIVGEAGPEAVIGDQVIPLDENQSPDVLSEILKAVVSGSADFLQEGGSLDDRTFVGPEGEFTDPNLINTFEQFRQTGGFPDQQLDFLPQLQEAAMGAGREDVLRGAIRNMIPNTMQGQAFESVGLQPQQQTAASTSPQTGLNMDAVNAITGVQPAEQPDQTSLETGVETATQQETNPQTGFQTGPDTPSVRDPNAPDPFARQPSGGGGGGAAGNQGNQEGQPPVGGQQTQFQQGTQQGQGAGATGMIQRLLEQNPEQQAFGTAQDLLTGEGGLLAREPGAGVIGAMQPVFQQNLESGLRELTNQVPSVFNSGAAISGTDLTRQALQDFNLQAAQAAQQGVGQQLQGLGTLGQLAQPAGQNPFQRALGAGQFGLAAQEQQFQQQTQPAMQLLMAALQQASPTAFQTLALGQA